MKKVEELSVKIFADGADKAGMLEMYAKPYIKGLTTNPTLMSKVGISDYKAFAEDILSSIKDKSISFMNDRFFYQTSTHPKFAMHPRPISE